MQGMVEFLLQTGYNSDSVHIWSQFWEIFSESLDVYAQKFTILRVLIVEHIKFGSITGENLPHKKQDKGKCSALFSSLPGIQG